MLCELTGNWKKGLAFDLHTLGSIYLGPDQFGHDQFENTRSEIGELVYQLKFHSDKSTIPKIIEILKAIKGIEKFDYIIPVPSSKARKFQPVDAITIALGKQRGVRVLIGFLEKKTSEEELKNVTDPKRREEILKDGIMVAGNRNLQGKSVLLVDDIFRSGATLNTCCSVLQENTGVKSVSVLTMTKTRSNR